MAEGLGTTGEVDAQPPSDGPQDAPLQSGGADDTQQPIGGAEDLQLSRAGADDAPISSGDAEEQTQKLQAEIEKLRRALADAEHDELVLHAQSQQLQADLTARYAQSA